MDSVIEGAMLIDMFYKEYDNFLVGILKKVEYLKKRVKVLIFSTLATECPFQLYCFLRSKHLKLPSMFVIPMDQLLQREDRRKLVELNLEPIWHKRKLIKSNELVAFVRRRVTHN